MFLNASPSHETFVDARYRRSLGRPVTGAPVQDQAGPTEPPVRDGPAAGAPDSRSVAEAGEPHACDVRREDASHWYQLERPGPLPAQTMFTGLPGRVVAALHPYTEGDPVGVLATLLSAFSAAIGHRPHIRIGSSRHPLVIWTMLIGRTALGRKGTTTGAAMEIFERVSGDFTERHILYGSPSSGAGLVGKPEAMGREAGWVEGADEDPVLRPGFPALMIEEEWAKVMRRSRIDDALGQNLRTAWQGNTLSVIVKKKADCATVPKAHVAIVGHVTPDEFRANLSASDVAGGTFNRFLPLYVQRCQSLPLADRVPETSVQGLAAELRSAVEHARTTGLLDFDDTARAYRKDELYDRLTGLSTGSELIESFAGRAVPYTKRIAAVYALADRCGTITPRHLKSAEAFTTYVIASVEHIMATAARPPGRRGGRATHPEKADPQIRHRVLGALLAAHPAPVSRSDLLAKIKNIGSTADLDDALASFGGDLLPMERSTGGGRPVRLYRLTDAAARGGHGRE